MSLSPCRPQRGFSARSASSAPSGGHGRGSFSSRSLISFERCQEGSRGRAWGSRGRLAKRSGKGSGGPGLSTCPPGGIQEVTINQNLLTPLKIEIDPQFQVVKTRETQEIRTLNNQFASFIDKVRFLEQQNKILETKWHLLQQLEVSDSSQSLESVFEAHLAQLRKQLEQLQRERGTLDAELTTFQKQEEEYKAKYELEAHRHATVENDFGVLKKEADGTFLSKMELEGKLEALREFFCFLTRLYEEDAEPSKAAIPRVNEERSQLQTQVSDTSVVLSMDNNRCLDFSDIIAEVRARYEEIAWTSKAEAEALYQKKYQELQSSAQLHGDNMKETKIQISQLQHAIQTLQSQIDSLKGQNANVQLAIGDTERRGELALKDANSKLDELEGALRMARQDMARLLRDYQELMSAKLSLDVEIAMYRRLLEGEECRISGECTSQVTISARGGSDIVPGGTGGSRGGTCRFRGGKGLFGSGCSSVVTGGFGNTLGSGQGPALGSCSVSGSGFSSSSSCSHHTILKETVESSLKTSTTY